MTDTAQSDSSLRALALLSMAFLAAGGCNAAHTPAGQSRPSGEPDAGHSQDPNASSQPTDDAVPNKPTFTARLAGDLIALDVDREILFGFTCTDDPVVEKRSGDAWVATINDLLPPNSYRGYYLDGEYVPPSQNAGCDGVDCGRLPLWASAVEFVKTGTRAPPADVVGGPTLVDVIETRPLSGLVQVNITYSEDRQCAETFHASVELTIPASAVDAGT